VSGSEDGGVVGDRRVASLPWEGWVSVLGWRIAVVRGENLSVEKELWHNEENDGCSVKNLLVSKVLC
jgi:hypothetical protein